MRTQLLSFTLLATLFVAAPAHALDLLPPQASIEQVIDHYLDARLKAEKVTPAPQADDAALVRRLTLDLVGRIPTVAETQAFVASSDPAKRVQLVERLLASPAFVRHQATQLDSMLMAGTRGSVRDYLLQAVAEGRTWDRIFRELVVPDDKEGKGKGPGEFLRQRINDLDRVTAEVSSIFFGVNVSCAQCHDHPLVPDWKQDHFYGMKSFFSRTFDNGGFLAEREVGLVKFKTTKGVDRQAKLMFLTGKVIDTPTVREASKDEEKKDKDRFESHKKNKTPPPPPSFSARAQLVDLALQPGQSEFFARSIANRTWHRFFGRGLVMPLDQMHSENLPSHPELLAWLARDTAMHGYDLKRLVRGIVLSKAYARSSRWPSDDAPQSNLFAVARVRPLTPMQLATSLRLATTDPVSLEGMKSEDLEKRMEGIENGARGLASSFEQPGDDFQVSVAEALLFSNADRVEKELLDMGGDRLLARIKQIKEPREAIETAVRTVLSRPPTAQEVKVMGEYVSRRSGQPIEAYRQLVWAMLTSSEFRFNY